MTSEKFSNIHINYLLSSSKRTAQTEENEQLSILEHDISASKTAANKAIVKYISEKTGQSTR